MEPKSNPNMLVQSIRMASEGSSEKPGNQLMENECQELDTRQGCFEGRWFPGE